MTLVHICGSIHGEPWRTELTGALYEEVPGVSGVTDAVAEYAHRYAALEGGRKVAAHIGSAAFTPGRVFEMAAWELSAIRASAVCVFVFRRGDVRGDGLLQLGYAISAGIPIAVCCDPGQMRFEEISGTLHAAGMPPPVGWDKDYVIGRVADILS